MQCHDEVASDGAIARSARSALTHCPPGCEDPLPRSLSDCDFPAPWPTDLKRAPSKRHSASAPRGPSARHARAHAGTALRTQPESATFASEDDAPFLRHESLPASPHHNNWQAPDAYDCTLSSPEGEDMITHDEPLAPQGPPDSHYPGGDSLDGLALRSQSSDGSLAPPPLHPPPEHEHVHAPMELAEPVWVVSREQQNIIVQMLVDEQQTIIDPEYMQYHGVDVQQDGDWITPSMRYMTVTWMSEAIDDLHLSQAVCCMSITLLDRYLSAARAFPRSMLQLAAGTCMFVATKIEGMLPHPPASAFVSLADGAFELDDIVLFERILCQTLGFHLCAPTVHNFLSLFESTLELANGSVVDYIREHMHHMACYLLELAMCSFEMLRTPRHVLAVSAIVLAYSNPGVLQHVADSAETPFEAVQGFCLDAIASFRSHFGPDLNVNAVTQCAGEMLRLLRVSACTVEEPFVVQKFRMPKYCSVARLSTLMTAEDFRSTMLTFVGPAV